MLLDDWLDELVLSAMELEEFAEWSDEYALAKRRVRVAKRAIRALVVGG